jgi:hypothetical protein
MQMQDHDRQRFQINRHVRQYEGKGVEVSAQGQSDNRAGAKMKRGERHRYLLFRGISLLLNGLAISQVDLLMSVPAS